MSGVTNPVEERKPAAQNVIHLDVKGQFGNEVFFNIKRGTTHKKLMNAYCDCISVEYNAVAFLFGGRRLHAEQTLNEVELENGDEIDAMMHQIGGVNKEEGKKPADRTAFIHLAIKGQLKMEDWDEIDAMLHQTGGAMP